MLREGKGKCVIKKYTKCNVTAKFLHGVLKNMTTKFLELFNKIYYLFNFQHSVVVVEGTFIKTFCCEILQILPTVWSQHAEKHEFLEFFNKMYFFFIFNTLYLRNEGTFIKTFRSEIVLILPTEFGKLWRNKIGLNYQTFRSVCYKRISIKLLLLR